VQVIARFGGDGQALAVARMIETELGRRWCPRREVSGP
jgi:hypothetical protein